MEGYHIRAPSLKRGRSETRLTDVIKLEKVLGVTVANNSALSSDNTGIVAYPAGCTVVLFNTRNENQEHIINTSRKTITCLSFSSCGRYIVTGECGHQPAVRIWDLNSDTASNYPGLAPQVQQVAEFIGHSYGVNCVSFSPSGKYVVSVGTQHDMIVNVWDWKNNIKVASNKVSTKIKAVAFAENGNYFVTVGNRHVKFWYLEYGKSKYKEAVPLMGRSAILGEQRNNYFCDVACGKAQCGDSTYVITRSGLLCEFNNRRLLDKWVELRTTRANCLTIGENYIFVGCAEGIIRCFDPTTLRFITTLPRTHYLGVDVSLGTSITHMTTPPPDAKYPDTIALTYNQVCNKLTSIYNDHSVYVWDVFNVKRVGKSYSSLYHSACIWGVEIAPSNSPLPPGSFLTCGSDDTIRVWNLNKFTETTSNTYRSNIYSNELLKIVYADKELLHIKDFDFSVGNMNDKQQSGYDSRNGVRSIRISPDGKNLAAGDRAGNIRIYDTETMKELCKIEAHDAEVLCLEYSGTKGDVNLMASASRDRLLHVFDVNRGYEFLQTLGDHSSSITAVRFLHNQPNLQMVSCGADKSLIFRSLVDHQFKRLHNATGKTTFYDMELDSGHKHVITACQDRNLRMYNVNTGKHTKTLKGSTSDDGTLIKVVLDRAGLYLATSCTDKSLSVYDYYSGECMATMCGHSELATGLRFTNDCRKLISVSGDGCIFVWKVPQDMVVTMHARLSQQAMREGRGLDSEILNERREMSDNEVGSSYRFSIGQLPQWAKKQLTEDTSHIQPQTKNVVVPKGRWAQRVEHPLEVQSFYSNNSILLAMEEKFDSDGSKDSSLESRREVTTERFEKVTIRRGSRRETVSDTMTDTGFESTAHDGDIDSDHEYRHRPLYYPTQADSASGSEFTVTNIDADELRKSQRKKKGTSPQIVIQPSTYTSQDSDDDDDEASTPSGENTDRNPMSLLSVSSESLDQIGYREKYLQSTFESMSGAEMDPSPRKTTISNNFLRSSNINMAAINAVKLTKSDPEATMKRQMLNKKIAETKKKLESVGRLKNSKSTHDLSHIPEKEQRSKTVFSVERNAESNLRKSLSLSDLSMQKPVAKYKKEVSGKPISRTLSRYAKNSPMMKSQSSTTLNQTDSDSNDKKVSRLMRPTISSFNKQNSKPLQNRKKISYSMGNLSTVGVDNLSTSDDEIEAPPSVPPRSRLTWNGAPSVTPRRNLNNKERSKVTRSNSHYEWSRQDLDTTLTNDNQHLLLSASQASQMCDNVCQQLVETADNVINFYNQFKEIETESEENLNTMRKLEVSIFNTIKILHGAVFQKYIHNNENQTDLVKRLKDLIVKTSSGTNDIVNVMAQYSEVLLEMVQENIHTNENV